ncbi:head to tail connecting protein [Caudoviricetes sp.]|nr:head to tail connecting protein [Caudoviricetes sp.]
MPLVPNIRLDNNPEDAAIGPMDVTVENAEEEADIPEFDQDGAILRIDHGDGSITVSLDGKPISEAENEGPEGWFDNLVDEIDDMELGIISEELLRGISDDLMSRKEWVEDRAQGMKLLGLKIEMPGIQGSNDGAPVEGMSKVRHPLLQEAVLRFQANARSEMLPTDGPVKIRDDGNSSSSARDEMADAFEKDFNHFLTVTATEYYPDTDRMFLLLGFGGTSFKKVYYCPLRNRPVSESVDADDLIVNNAATDLSNARRVTHRVYLKPSTVRRLQILGVYRDIELATPILTSPDSVQEAKASQQGVTLESMNPDDRDREIYEVYCELDIKGFEHKYKGKPSGLEIPYRVTIDVSSRQILSIVRNYNEDTAKLPEARKTFVKYTFVPGFGFYDIGLLHVLGNTTNAVTAAWRELLDAGMYANFPGFLISDTGSRQNTNVFRIPPGGAAQVKTGGQPIGQAVMPLPYKEPSQALMALTDNIATTGMRLGGTSELQVGEGRADAPVGTTLAMIEQATKVLNSVHKRMHAAQAEEFTLLRDCFREHPESFWERNRRPTVQWNPELLMAALDDVELVPQADPNTSSHAQRVMKIMALKQLQSASPGLYDPVAVDKAALRAIGWSNPEQFLKPEADRNQPPPELLKGIEEIKIAHQKADADTMRAQADMLKAQQGHAPAAPGAPGPDPREFELKMMAEQNKARQLDHSMQRDMANDENRDLDREKDLRMEQMRMDRDQMNDAVRMQHEKDMQLRDHHSDILKLAMQVQAQKKRDK